LLCSSRQVWTVVDELAGSAVHGRFGGLSVEAVAGGVVESLEMPALTVGALARGFIVVLIAGGVAARPLRRSKTELDVDLRGGASDIIKNDSPFDKSSSISFPFSFSSFPFPFPLSFVNEKLLSADCVFGNGGRTAPKLGLL